MLQLNKPKTEISRDPVAAEMLSGADTLHLFLGFVRRQFSVALFSVFLLTALGAIYLFTTRPSFTAQAQLLIDTHKVQIFQQQSILGDVPIDTAQVESQVQVLKSENVASTVIKNLHLTEDPEFVSPGGGLLGAVYKALSSGNGEEQSISDFELFRRAMSVFQSRLNVKRIGLTYVIEIDFRSYSAERAAEIANAVADAYIEDQLEAKYQATRRASAWLQERIRELRDQVSNAERAVVDFKTKNNIVSTGGIDRPLLGQQQVTELSSQLTIARAQSAEARARLERINSVLKADLPNAAIGETVTDTLKNEIVTKLRTQYLELSAREAEWSTKYGRDHLAVVNLRNQMRELRNSIFEELKRLGETYKSDYEIAKQRELGVQQQLSLAVTQSQAADAKSVTLRELQSTAQTYKTIYDNFLQRYMEAVQQQSFPITESRLISAASRPLGKSGPNAFRVLTVAWLGGIVLAVGIGVFRELSDRVFRSPEQVETLLQTNCIALVPQVAKAKSGKRRFSNRRAESGEYRRAGNRNGSKAPASVAKQTEMLAPKTEEPAVVVDVGDLPPSLGTRTVRRGNDVPWTVVDAPFSQFTEAIRAIKLANDLNASVKANRVVGLTSALPNEGKSTIALSLAQLTAQVGMRTILVDCDLRNPSLTRSLAPRAKMGLVELIAEKVSFEDVMWTEPSTSFSFLPAVTKFRIANSTELLSSPSTRKLIDMLREKFDYVILDLPPIAPIVDVRATAHLVDSFVFVIEWGRTKIDVVEHALGHAQGVYDNLLGVVLNKVNMNTFVRYASHKESFYYNKHYARYGYTD